jgi:hypothetical protein
MAALPVNQDLRRGVFVQPENVPENSGAFTGLSGKAPGAWPLERDGGYAGGALAGGLGGRPEPPM